MHSNKKISHTDTNQLDPQSENPFLGIKKSYKNIVKSDVFVQVPPEVITQIDSDEHGG